MNKRQKAMLVEVATVLLITLIAVLAMINFKDYINRSEAINAMQQIGGLVTEYRKEHARVPADFWIRSEMADIKGSLRLPDMVYRGLWIDFDAEPNDILAYAKKDYPSSLLDDGYVVLMFDANAVWMDKAEFEELLDQQQDTVEKEMTGR